MSDGMRRLVLLLRERAVELTALADGAHSLSTQWTSKDVEDFLLHRADVIKSEVEILQRQIHRLLSHPK
jgi:hypothetical protein